MTVIYCDSCGGLVSDPATVSHRLSSAAIVLAQPQSGPCGCTPPIVYGPPAGYMSWPGIASLVHTFATRN